MPRVATVDPPDRPELLCWIEGSNRRRSICPTRQFNDVVVHIAQTAENLLHGACSFELFPIVIVREPLLQPPVMNAPVADKEIKIVQASHCTRWRLRNLSFSRVQVKL